MKYKIILSVFIFITITFYPAVATAESASTVHKSIFAKNINPTLVDLQKLYVIVKPVDTEQQKDGLVWTQLQQRVEKKIKEAGIEVIAETATKAHDIPELRVSMEMLKFNQSQLYVFRLQISLATRVYLKQRKVSFKAEAWKAEPTIQAVPVKNMPAKVTYAVLEQVQKFINAHKLANLQNPLGDNIDSKHKIQQEQTRPAVKRTIEYKYVASKNSKIFHKPGCSSAKRISPKNLVGYTSRDNAANSGKRPCLLCKP